MKPDTYNPVAIPDEPGRYWVNSKSRPSMIHVVDMGYQESKGSKRFPVCQCESYLANKHHKGKPCVHIISCIPLEQKRLGLKVTL